MAPKHGLFIWTDLQTSDPDAARSFYADVFGWESEDVDDDAMPYWQFTKDGQLVAGVGPQGEEQEQDGVPPNWTSYVAVDDIDEVCSAASENGGEVLMSPTEVPDAGSFAILADPSGAVIGLWQSGEHTGADVFNEPGSMCWNELVTPDVDRAKEFYGAILPWQLDTEDRGGFDYTTIVLDDRPNGGMFAPGRSLQEGASPHWLVYFAVEDTDGALEAVREGGGEVLGEPQDTPFGRVATVTDPQGATFRIIQLEQVQT